MEKSNVTIKSIVISSALILIGGLSFYQKDNTIINNVTLENIEALAEGEGIPVEIACIGSGDLTCPLNGSKVMDYVIWYTE